MLFYALGFLVVVTIVILWCMSTMKEEFSSDILSGYWEANDEFLDKNDISKFAMAIGSNDSSVLHNNRNIYIVMLDRNGDILINENSNMKLTSNWSNINPFNKKIKYKVKLDIPSDVIPSDLNMIYEPTSGFISLYDDDTIYAELYRNNILSDLEVQN